MMPKNVEICDYFNIDLNKILEEYNNHILPLMGYFDGNELLKIQQKFHLVKYKGGTHPIMECIPYTKKLCEIMQQYIDFNQVSFRIVMPHKSYTWHKDPQEFNFHIPLITNPDCYFSFLNEDKINLLPGKLYKVQTNLLHTFKNDSDKERLHLMFEKFKGWRNE